MKPAHVSTDRPAQVIWLPRTRSYEAPGDAHAQGTTWPSEPGSVAASDSGFHRTVGDMPKTPVEKTDSVQSRVDDFGGEAGSARRVERES